jgi:hypothetical protein
MPSWVFLLAVMVPVVIVYALTCRWLIAHLDRLLARRHERAIAALRRKHAAKAQASALRAARQTTEKSQP